MTVKRPNLPAIRSQGTAVEVTRPGGSLVSRVSGEAVRYLPNITKKTYRVGDYELNEQSYRQIMVWLDQIKASGGDVTLEGFARAQLWDPEIIFNFIVERFREKEGFDIRCDQLAVIRIRHAAEDAQVQLAHSKSVRISIPFITAPSIHINELINHGDYRYIKNRYNNKSIKPWIIDQDIIAVRLFSMNEIDLSSAPKLRKVRCCDNNLEYLDISKLPDLIELDCRRNKLTKLDISMSKKLNKLDCSKNFLTNLDLSNSWSLKKLKCNTQLTAPEMGLKNIDIRRCVTREFEFFMENQFNIQMRPDQIIKPYSWTA